MLITVSVELATAKVSDTDVAQAAVDVEEIAEKYAIQEKGATVVEIQVVISKI